MLLVHTWVTWVHSWGCTVSSALLLGPHPGGTGGPSWHREPVAGLLAPAPAVCHGHCACDAPCDAPCEAQPGTREGAAQAPQPVPSPLPPGSCRAEPRCTACARATGPPWPPRAAGEGWGPWKGRRAGASTLPGPGRGAGLGQEGAGGVDAAEQQVPGRRPRDGALQGCVPPTLGGGGWSAVREATGRAGPQRARREALHLPPSSSVGLGVRGAGSVFRSGRGRGVQHSVTNGSLARSRGIPARMGDR